MSSGIASIQAGAAAVRRAPKSVATRSSIYKQGTSTVGTTGTTSHHVMRVLATCSNPFLRYGNFSFGGASTVANDILVSARLVTVDSRIVTVTWGGATTVRITAGRNWVDSDDIAETLTGGTTVAVRTFVRGDTVGSVAPNDWFSDTGNGQPWFQTGDHLDDVAAPTPLPGPAYANTFYYSPLGLYSRQLSSSTTPHFGLLGDSNFHGQGDDQSPPATNDLTGLARRAVNNQYPYIHLSESGMGIVQVAEDAGHPVRSLLPGIDYLIIGMLVNDLGANRTAAQIVADVNTVAGWAKQVGCRSVIACTCQPNTASTDNWATTANQTVTAQESIRTAINTTYRTTANMNAGGSLGNVDWIADCAAVVEVDDTNTLTLNGGKWKVAPGTGNPPSFGSDPHYTSQGHAAAATVIQAAMTQVLAGNRGGLS